MREFGFEQDIVLSNDAVTIDQEKIKLKIPFVLEIEIPRTDFEGSNFDIKKAIEKKLKKS